MEAGATNHPWSIQEIAQLLNELLHSSLRLDIHFFMSYPKSQ
jgi:hypothetical protein